MLEKFSPIAQFQQLATASQFFSIPCHVRMVSDLARGEPSPGCLQGRGHSLICQHNENEAPIPCVLDVESIRKSLQTQLHHFRFPLALFLTR
jgi:hypothetical protein